MPSKPPRWSLDQLREAALGRTAIWCEPVVEHLLSDLPACPSVTELDELTALGGPIDTLIAVGGGSLLDRAKFWRRHDAPTTQLVAIPSLWGSGAEASPVVVLTNAEGKDVRLDEAYLPDARLVLPGLATALPEPLARWGCGDSWSHALEGFLSPLADADLQRQLAALLKEMLALGVGRDVAWFELSARACAGQSRSSVGLVHGFAHALEVVARDAIATQPVGHARLCATFLWPVMRFNREHGPKLEERFAAYGLDVGTVFSVLENLHEPELYLQLLPLIETHWKRVLRDPCSRTNGTLVRPGHLPFFLGAGEA